MATVQNGDTVKVHYTGKLDDGTIFDSSQGNDPLELTIGEEKVIPGFEQAVVGMKPGQSKDVTVPADQAYGPRYDEMVVRVERDKFPDHLDPKVGQQLHIRREDGEAIRVMVTGISESDVTLDANHPLAGQDLTFEIELVEIV